MTETEDASQAATAVPATSKRTVRMTPKQARALAARMCALVAQRPRARREVFAEFSGYTEIQLVGAWSGLIRSGRISSTGESRATRWHVVATEGAAKRQHRAKVRAEPKADALQVDRIVDLASPVDQAHLRAALDFIFAVGSISAARRALEAAGDRIRRVQE